MTRRFNNLILLVELCLLSAVIYIFTRHVFIFDFTCDDAFISFRYAENLVRHGELVYNPGIRVEGYSNFLWTLMIAGGMRLGASPQSAASVLGWLMGAFGIILTWQAGKAFYRRHWGAAQRPAGEREIAALLTAILAFFAPLVLAASSSYACWSSGGLETQLFTLLLAAAMFRFLIEEHDEAAGPRRWSGLLFALAALARPEGVAMFALAAGWRGAKLLWRRTRWGGEGPGRPGMGRDLEGLLMFAIPVTAWLMWKVAYYGDVLPNTFYIKGGGFDMVKRGGNDLYYYLKMTKAYVLLPLVLAGLAAGPVGVRGRRRGLDGQSGSGGQTMTFLFIAAALFFLYYVWIGGDFMELARFVVPAFPLLAILAQEGVLCFFELGGAPRREGRATIPAGEGGPAGPPVGRRSSARRWIVRGAVLALALAFLAVYAKLQASASRYAMTNHSYIGTDSIGYLKLASKQWEIVGKWIRKDAGDRDATVAVSAAGAIAYFSKLPTLDLLGLNDPVIPKAGVKFGNRPGHTHGSDWNYILLWEPDYFIGHPEIDPKPKKLMQADAAFMGMFGYERRVVKIPGLDPPYLSFWYRKPDRPNPP